MNDPNNINIINFLYQRAIRRERVFRDRLNPLDYSDNELLSKYRFDRRGINYILSMLNLDSPTKRSNALNAMQRLCLALRFYSGGSFLQTCSDTIGVSEATASRVVTLVTEALCEIANQNIRMPTSDREISEAKEQFYEIANFPGVVGLIDCTHVRIQAPTEHEQEYVNRKQYHSLNVQLIVDAKQNIRNVVSQWPGSVHDSRILKNSGVWEQYESGRGQGYILGDSGYPCKSWLLTPVLRPTTEKEERYNRAHCRTRVIIEQTNGTLKRIFACLHNELRFTPEKCSRVAVACCVLFNIRKHLGMPEDEVGLEVIEEDIGHEHLAPEGNGAATRQHVITTYF